MSPDHTFRYQDRADAVVDVHLPPADARGLLFLVHGGFWKQEWDRTHTRPMARALADDGWVVATPEYRRVRGGGGWPTTGDDVRAAFAATLSYAGGGVALPGAPRVTVVAGHSAGGHLALWLAATGAPMDRVVALAPVCDLREAIRLGLGDHATEALLGSVDPSVADPMTLLDVRPSASVAIVHGVDDVNVPISLSRGLVQRHPWVDLHEVSGAAHFEVIEPGSLAWPTVTAALLG
jgi:acetyl esterase/lipase